MRRRAPLPEALLCPCQSGAPFEQCCAPCLNGLRPAADAAALMRSRYTAYTRQDWAYLRATWAPETCPAQLEDPQPPRWLGLTVRHHRTLDEHHAEVEFVARYKVGGQAHRLHECSRFRRSDGRWLYVDGDLLD